MPNAAGALVNIAQVVINSDRPKGHNAKLTKCSTKSGRASPIALAASGSNECSVIPGRVFVSSSQRCGSFSSWSPGSQMKSVRE